MKAGGCVNDKRQQQPHFLSLKQGLPNISATGLSPEPQIPPCISMGLFLHKERSTTARPSHRSPVVKPFFMAETIELCSLLSDNKQTIILHGRARTCVLNEESRKMELPRSFRGTGHRVFIFKRRRMSLNGSTTKQDA